MKTLTLKFHGGEVTEEDFKEVMEDTSEKELHCCLGILNMLTSYIPSKEKSNHIINQLHLYF
jgi:hypothetical protein